MVILVASSSALIACGRGCSKQPVAILAEAAGTVQRDELGAIDVWLSAPVDAGIALGEGVRTGANGRARLELSGGGGLRMGPHALVRFGGRPDEPPNVELGRGEIEVEAEEALDLITEFGSVRVERGGRVRAVRGEDGTQIEVLFGLAQLEGGRRLRAGETYGRPRSNENAVRTAPAGVESAATPGSQPGTMSDDVVEDVARDDGTSASLEAEASRATGPRLPSVSGFEFVVSGGAGGVVHHPSPPALVGVRTGCNDGEVRVASSAGTITYTGGGTVGVRLPRGQNAYEVTCGGQPSSAGRLTVTNDGGRQRLNTESQRHRVDADGRRYTFLYEGTLPTLALRWPNAPAAEQYTLRLTGTRGRSQLTSASPATTVPRSALREGEVTFQFEGGGRTSPVTHVTLRYDTATPTAYLSSPVDRGFGPGASVQISGTAQPGSRVAVGAEELVVDGRGSFSGTATADSGGLAVRITSTRGVHYFVRRTAGGG